MSEPAPAHEYLETAEKMVESASHGGLREAIVPLSIAAMAVLAAVFGSIETTAASSAVLARSDASVRQGEATDLWGYFQAKSIKRNMYEIAADQSTGNRDQMKSKAEKLGAEEAALKGQAEAKEKEVAAQIAVSETAMERHHRLTIATSIIHLAIALASVSLVVGRRWLWFGSLASVVVGILVGVI